MQDVNNDEKSEIYASHENFSSLCYNLYHFHIAGTVTVLYSHIRDDTMGLAWQGWRASGPSCTRHHDDLHASDGNSPQRDCLTELTKLMIFWSSRPLLPCMIP